MIAAGFIRRSPASLGHDASSLARAKDCSPVVRYVAPPNMAPIQRTFNAIYPISPSKRRHPVSILPRRRRRRSKLNHVTGSTDCRRGCGDRRSYIAQVEELIARAKGARWTDPSFPPRSGREGRGSRLHYAGEPDIERRPLIVLCMPRLFPHWKFVRNRAVDGAAARRFAGARWVEPENYHLTLRFIGDVDDALAEEIADLLSKVDGRRSIFALTASTVRGNRPRAVVAAVPRWRTRGASSRPRADHAEGRLEPTVDTSLM